MNIKKLFSWLHIVATLGPIILTLIPGVPNALIPKIIQLIQEVEKLGLSGEEKKTRVMSSIENTIAGINNTPGEDKIPVEGTLDKVSKGIDKVITATNLIHLGH